MNKVAIGYVLVVTGSGYVNHLLTHILEDMGYKILSADSLACAFKFLEEKRVTSFELMIIDFDIISQSGSDLIHRATTTSSSPPAIIFYLATAYDLRQFKKLIADLNFFKQTYFLSKGDSFDHVMKVLRHATRRNDR